MIDASADPEVIRAAGGILWRRDGQEPSVAVVHRPKYDDWSFPKGKLESGESWQQAAIREVEEETGCEAALGAFAGQIAYLVRGRPKVVLYWNMERAGDCRFEANSEIDLVEWLPVQEALARLDHPGERKLLNENRDH